MAAPKRTQKQREADFVRLGEMYVKGWTHAAIAEVIGVSRQMISRDVKDLLQRWRDDTALAIDEYKVRELQKIDRMEREAWSAWERSCEGKEKKMQRRGMTSGGEVDVKEQVLTATCGDPRFMDIILRCIDRRCKLLGLDAPQKVDASVRRDPLEERSEEEVAEMMKVVLDEFVADKAQTRVVDE